MSKRFITLIATLILSAGILSGCCFKVCIGTSDGKTCCRKKTCVSAQPQQQPPVTDSNSDVK